MKKAVLLASLAVVTAGVCGMQNDAFQSNDNKKNGDNHLSYAAVARGKHSNKNESVKTLKDKGKQIISPNEDISSEFWSIFNNPNSAIHEVDSIVKKYPSLINVRDEKGNTPLHIALSKYLTVKAKHLMDDLHFDINAQNYNGDTPLISCLRAYRDIREAYLKEDVYKALIHLFEKEDLDVNVINKDKTSALTIAMRIGNKSILWKLLKCGVDINTLNRRQIPESSLNILKSFEEHYTILDDLKKGLYFSAWDKAKFSKNRNINGNHNPLFRCARLCSLVSSTPNKINSTNERGDTALTLACAFNFEKVAENMLKQGANPNKPNEQSGDTALMIASKKNHLNLAKLLIEYGADVNQINELTNNTALIVASQWGRIKIVDLLLKHGANPYYKNDGHTAYHYAKLFNHEDVAEQIQSQTEVYDYDPTSLWGDDVVEDAESVKSGSNVIMNDSDEQNKYEQFSEKIIPTNEQQHWTDICMYQSQLLNQLSKVSQQLKFMSDQIQKQSAEIEILKKDNSEMKQLLASKRKRSDSEDETDETDLKRYRTDYLSLVPQESYDEFKQALKEVNTTEIRRLISRYPQLVVKRDHQEGWTPLMKIICDKKTEEQDKYITVQAVLEANEKVNKKSNKKNLMINAQELSGGNSALNMAVIRKDSAIVKLLLKYGANPNTQDKYGWTPLILSAEYGYPEIMKRLIKYGADLHLKTSKNNTALRRAMLSKNIQSEEDRYEMVEMLIKADPEIITNSVLSEAKKCNLREISWLLEKHKKRSKSHKRNNDH